MKLALALTLALALLSALVAPGLALAHQVGLSRGTYRWVDEGAQALFVFARGDATALLEGAGDVAPDALETRGAEVGRRVRDGALVRRLGKACTGKVVHTGLVEEDGFEVAIAYTCEPAPAGSPGPGAPRLELALLDELAPGHRHLASVVDDAEAELASAVLHKRDRVLLIQRAKVARKPGAPEAPPTPEPEPARTSALARAGEFVKLGVEHILTGYDHLAFLLGLVLVRAKLKARVLTITAFTLGHSVTLALALLGVVAPPPAPIEIAIALSVAWVGVENFFLKDGEKRWRLTLAFGLVHGFGFAGALGEIKVPKGDVPLVLASFNVGVELGQLAVMALVLPLVMALEKKPVAHKHATRAVSAALVAAGLIWAGARIHGALAIHEHRERVHRASAALVTPR